MGRWPSPDLRAGRVTIGKRGGLRPMVEWGESPLCFRAWSRADDHYDRSCKSCLRTVLDWALGQSNARTCGKTDQGIVVKNLPGRKTDVSDAAGLAQLGAHGFVQGSFVPPELIRQRRDLTRPPCAGTGKGDPAAGLAAAANAPLVTEKHTKQAMTMSELANMLPFDKRRPVTGAP
jgi:hypothetical protein